MYWLVAALLVCFGVSLSEGVSRRQISLGGQNCDDGVARVNVECGLTLPEVTSTESLYEALKASCTSQTCSDAVLDAVVACNPVDGLSTDDIRKAHSTLSTFYCKRHPNGDKCGVMILESDMTSIDTMGCGLTNPPRVPRTCSQACSQLASTLAETYGCCWTEFIDYSQQLLPIRLSGRPNATEFWTRCGVDSPGVCETSFSDSGRLFTVQPTSGQVGTLHTQRFALGVSILTSFVLSYLVRALF